jgi:hypothetical protein
MKITRAPGLLAAGAVGLAGLGVGATFAPAAASAAASSTTQAVTSRVTSIKNALAGLVKDGTLTQAQANKVATTLDTALPRGGGFGGHGGHGMDLDAAAKIIGVTTDQLRTSLESGKTLAAVAQTKGISQASLVDKLVAAEKTRIAAAVKAGQLTQPQADSIAADLKARVTERVTSTRPAGGRGDHGDDGDAAAGTTAPSANSSSSSAAPTSTT